MERVFENYFRTSISEALQKNRLNLEKIPANAKNNPTCGCTTHLGQGEYLK